MAKKNDYTQVDMFPVIPEVTGLGITGFRLSGASITATVEGATNVNDFALLDNPCWQKAIAKWLVTLCGTDIDIAMVQVKKAYVDLINEQGETHRPTPTPTDDLTGLVKEAMGQVIDEQIEKRGGKNRKNGGDNVVIPMGADDRVITLPHLQN